MAAGEDPLHRYPPALRVASCAGEPLNPEVINWGKKHFGISICDHYGQTGTRHGH
jgi:acetyl-CoA synthetase